jgi:hypothetical protein
MCSWKMVRACCIVLLLVPVAHLVILLSQEAMASMEASPTVWQDAMDAHIRRDERASLPPKPVVVIGGRRVALWPALAATTAPKPVLARALGIATVNDLIYYHERLVAYYRPSAVVLLPGNSEFHIRDSKSAEELAAAIRALVLLDASQSTGRVFYTFLPIKTPLFPDDHATIDRTGALLRDWARGRPRLAVLDANPLLASAGGTPDPRYFRNDGVQLNEAGYLRLDLLLRQQLATDFPREYAFSPPF